MSLSGWAVLQTLRKWMRLHALLTILETCYSTWDRSVHNTPSSLNSETLFSSVGPILIGAGIGQGFLKVIHISLVFLASSYILFCTAHLSKWVAASCIWLTQSLKTSSYMVQSSAYLQVDTGIPLEMQSSISLTCTLKSVGEMTPPWGTPAITSPCLERTPGSLRGSLPKSGPVDFATKNTFPLFLVGEEALVGVY